jgi:hypothetical protein
MLRIQKRQAKQGFSVAASRLTRHSNLWQTVCSYGTVFALRVSLVRMQQARRKDREGHSHPARN